MMRVHPVALGLRGCVWGRLYGGQSKSHWMQWDGGRGDKRTADNGKTHVLLDLFKYVVLRTNAFSACCTWAHAACWG